MRASVTRAVSDRPPRRRLRSGPDPDAPAPRCHWLAGVILGFFAAVNLLQGCLTLMFLLVMWPPSDERLVPEWRAATREVMLGSVPFYVAAALAFLAIVLLLNLPRCREPATTVAALAAAGVLLTSTTWQYANADVGLKLTAFPLWLVVPVLLLVWLPRGWTLLRRPRGG